MTGRFSILVIGILVVIIVILSAGYFAPIGRVALSVAILAFFGALAGGLIAITGPLVLFFSNNRSVSMEKAEKLRDMWYDIGYGNVHNLMPWEVTIHEPHRAGMAFEYWKRFVFYGHVIDEELRAKYYDLRDSLTQEEELQKDEGFRKKHREFRNNAKNRVGNFEGRLQELRSKPLRSYYRVIEITEPRVKLKT